MLTPHTGAGSAAAASHAKKGGHTARTPPQARGHAEAIATQPLPDILVVASARSGGSWACHIAHQLRAGGRTPDFFCQEDVVPCLETYHDLFGTPAHTHPQPAAPRLFRTTASHGELLHAGLLDQHTPEVRTPQQAWLLSRSLLHAGLLDQRRGGGSTPPACQWRC